MVFSKDPRSALFVLNLFPTRTSKTELGRAGGVQARAQGRTLEEVRSDIRQAGAAACSVACRSYVWGTALLLALHTCMSKVD